VSRNEQVITYASKGLTLIQRKFHLVEGECYAFIWGIMHLKQYLYHNHFILRIDYKPLEWLATMLDVYDMKGQWINMFQDFNFKIVHCTRSKHGNVNARSKNLVGSVDADEIF